MNEKIAIEKCNKCMWFGVVSVIFEAIGLGLLIAGFVKLSQGNIQFDVVVIVGLIFMMFGILAFAMWCTCQYTVTNNQEKFHDRTMPRNSKEDSDMQLSNFKAQSDTLLLMT